MIVVSSCLAGLPVRYNGSHCSDRRIKQLIDEGKAVSYCPELLAGFSIPREPCELIGGDGNSVLDGLGKVVTKSGRDVTDRYLRGAKIFLEKVKELQAATVILKESSPSCGGNKIYNGEFSGKKIRGKGVTTALLERNGIKVISDEDLNEHFHKIN